MVRTRPFAPAAATGTVLTGLAIGAALGPLAFGILAETVSWMAAWVVTAGFSLLAAGVVSVVVHRRARSELEELT